MCTQHLGCWPRSPVPPPDLCGESETGLTVLVTIEGELRGPLGGIEGGCIYWYSSVHYGSAITGPVGDFVIQVPADATVYTPVVLYSYHPNFTWDTIVITNSAAAATTPQIFDVAYLHETTVTPRAINNDPPKTLIFSLITTAPASLSRSLAELPWGELVELQHDPNYTERPGWSKFSGGASPPAGTADSRYRFVSCVLKGPGTGSCSSPGSDLILSPTEPYFPTTGMDYRPYYIIDSVAPAITRPSPAPNRNTLNRRPVIYASSSDELSGVNNAATRIYLDGSEMAPITYGTSYRPPSDLALGMHTATITASDVAGNTSSLTWLFNVNFLSASAANVSIVPQTKPVNPNNQVPPPGTITFQNVVSQLEPYTMSLGPSPYIGLGTVSRRGALSALNVTFRNETGVPKSVTVNGGTAVFWSSAGLFFPTTATTTASIPSSEFVIPYLSVSVPTGYNTPDSVAELTMISVPVDAPADGEGDEDPLTTLLPPGNSILGFGIKAVTDLNEVAPNSVSPSTTQYLAVEAVATLPNGQSIAIYTDNQFRSPIPDGDLFNHPAPIPACDDGDPNTDDDYNTDCLHVGTSGSNGSLIYSASYFNLGEDAIQLYSNHWLYRRAEESVYLDWQQSSGRVRPTQVCPLDGTKSIRLWLSRFTNETRSLTQPLDPWKVTGFKLSPGVIEETDGKPIVRLTWSSVNSIRNVDGLYSADAEFESSQGGIDGWSVGTWLHPTGSQDTEQMITATELTSSTGTEYPKALQLLDRHYWTVKYENKC